MSFRPDARLITLLTDFGTSDGYVGEMKGVLAAEAPGVQIVDIAHDIPPHDVEIARLTVARYWRRFPPGSIHVVVIDPGVGGDRAGLAVIAEERALVGPDNGVLSPALLVPGARAVAIRTDREISATFHGRDVFAPAAALLATGTDVDSLGDPITPMVRRTPEPTRAADGSIAGEVIAIDRFGNAITNIIGGRGRAVEVAGRELQMCRTYADLPEGGIGALTGSSGFIEIALREGRASDVLKLRRGSRVKLRQG